MGLIVEGVKLSGKTSLIYSLNSMFPNYSIFENRGMIESGAFRYTLTNNIQQQLLHYYKFLNLLPNQNYILNRSHIFAESVLHLHQQKCSFDFRLVDETLKKTLIVLLTLDESTYSQRLKVRLQKGIQIHPFDMEVKNAINHQELLKNVCKKSKCDVLTFNTNKVHIKEIVTSIISFYQNHQK